MLPGILKCERVATLSEAQAQSQNSYLNIRERSAKDPRKISERSRRPSNPPALQAMGDDIASAIWCWSSGLGQVPTPLHLPGMLCGLAGSVLELRLCVKSSFESSGLGFSSNMLPRKLGMVCAKGTLDFREEVIFVMKGILDNAHMCMYVLTHSYCMYM